MASIRILIVESPALARSALVKALHQPGIEIVAAASDPYAAREKLVEFAPDVMVMGCNLPRLSAVVFVAKVMEHAPLPIVVVTPPDEQHEALRQTFKTAGAFRVVTGGELALQAVHAAMRAVSAAPLAVQVPAPSVETAKTPLLSSLPHKSAGLPKVVIAIASSTGGTEALKVLLRGLPANIPPIVIVQHMPHNFTRAYAEQLDRTLPFRVKEATDGDRLAEDLVLLAPGGRHMEVIKRGTNLLIKLTDDAIIHGVRPAADKLMYSLARYSGFRCIGVILTGMGRDGADGLRVMRMAGSYNIAQDESSSVIFGMPKAAMDLGAIDVVAPIERIASLILKRLKMSSVA